MPTKQTRHTNISSNTTLQKTHKEIIEREMPGSHCNNYGDLCLLGCDAVQSVRSRFLFHPEDGRSIFPYNPARQEVINLVVGSLDNRWL
jgi:hypothetical protein